MRHACPVAASFAQEMTSCSTAASELAAQAEDLEFAQPLLRLEEAAREVEHAWSGSNIGYQSLVYYAGFSKPPTGAHFSPEWGFMGMFQGTTGDWQEMDRNVVHSRILSLAGNPDAGSLEARSDEARRNLNVLKERASSILSGYLQSRNDDYVAGKKTEIANVNPPSASQFVRLQMRTGNTVTRDMQALGGGWQSAPHQEVLGQVAGCRSPYKAARDLAGLCASVAEHLERTTSEPPLKAVQQLGSKVFVGHGQSLQWHVLKDFVQDRLGLMVDEFNRVPVAGITNIERLREMLDEASVAFLVLTAEDEKTSGSVAARQNVVHEAGLFQGRLGFNRAIVMLEDGCEEFSNINGLGQIRFPAGHIEAKFEEVRRVLVREGLVRE